MDVSNPVWWGGIEGGERIPAITKLAPHILQVCIAHVLNGEDEDVLVGIDTISDLGEELLIVFAAGPLDRLGQGDHAVALAGRHFDGRWNICFLFEERVGETKCMTLTLRSGVVGGDGGELCFPAQNPTSGFFLMCDAKICMF